jgi:hypothetical protein
MYILYTDKQEVFECSISLEGASVKNSQARLIVESDNLTFYLKELLTLMENVPFLLKN